MSEPMFYCEYLPPTGEVAQLRGDEARHAGTSRRLKKGDELWLFDGRGAIARAQLQALHNRGSELDALIVERAQQAAPAPPLHLVCALPKGDRASVLVDMATQLGMTSLTPLLCERSVVDPGTGTLERLRRVALEACKQSRRAHLPTILAPTKIADVVMSSEAMWIAHPDGVPVAGLAQTVDQPLLLLIGPEGGFTDDEIALACGRGAQRVSLGSGILRVEAAAVALLAAVLFGRVPAQAS
ncbi:MAG TPA: RsmE family RNA methyltransferase [Burkholderiaceae bacterium]|nr:RsmE family RNA methyltransferase [Burkholderiaceae bacterium]